LGKDGKVMAVLGRIRDHVTFVKDCFTSRFWTLMRFVEMFKERAGLAIEGFVRLKLKAKVAIGASSIKNLPKSTRRIPEELFQEALMVGKLFKPLS